MGKTIQEIIEFTQELVMIPSQNNIDSEAGVAKLVFDKLLSFGFQPKIVGSTERPSVICYIKKENSAKTVWLESCLDTVPAGDLTKWNYPPFEGKIVGNKMYGRGAADSKVAIAMFCWLAKELVEEKRFNGSIFLGFDADEQSGNFSGVKEVIKHAPKADVCLLGYQGIDEISIGSRGNLVLKLTTLGKSAHTGSRSKKGINAIHSMAKAISMFTSLNLESSTESFFEFGSSLNVSQIKGGVAVNVVPDKCEASIDVRLVPSQDKKKVLDRIRGELERMKAGDKSFDYNLEVLQSYDSYLTDPEDRFIRLFQKTAQDILGKNIPLVASGQKSIGNVIQELHTPTINAFGVASDNVHAPNEWIDLDTVPKVFEIYKQSLIKFCQG